MASNSLGGSTNMNSYATSEAVKQAARRTVCARAVDSREAAELMSMLGIHPDQNDDDDEPRASFTH
jgi:hypothetical protein